ncbi:rev protein [Caprine arthritis encephalitis virus Ov496]|uniref:Rev protein n=1 Tax=Caprine arthritis encephalitis virus Ov496 TaxID=621214 RepID=C0JIH3_CAEV|nr:rev protein [Caprine arthritis encephalitis virus Ov496]
MDMGAKHMQRTGEGNWVEVKMEEQEREEEPLLHTRQQGIQDTKYPKIPKSYSDNGNKSRRGRRKRAGFWKWLRGIRNQQRAAKSNNQESMEQCVGALGNLTLGRAMEKEPSEAFNPPPNNGNMDKWTTWRKAQK